MNRLMVFLKYPEKKSVFKMTKEIINLWIKKKEIPFYYFKYVYRKTVPNYLDYISFKEQHKLVNHPSLRNPDYASLVDNKLFFSLFCQRTSIQTPKLITYNTGNYFFHNNDSIQITNQFELEQFFQKVMKEEGISSLFVRPSSDYGGHGCFKITESNIKTVLNEWFEKLINGKRTYLYNEVINQHDDINRIHATSVNTLRLITLITISGEIELISALMRFGVGSSLVDNATSGGFFVGINLEEGTFKQKVIILHNMEVEKFWSTPTVKLVLKVLKFHFLRKRKS